MPTGGTHVLYSDPVESFLPEEEAEVVAEWLPVVVTARTSLSSWGTRRAVTEVEGPMAWLALISISQGL